MLNTTQLCMPIYNTLFEVRNDNRVHMDEICKTTATCVENNPAFTAFHCSTADSLSLHVQGITAVCILSIHVRVLHTRLHPSARLVAVCLSK